jgi:hypothetical protein
MQMSSIRKCTHEAYLVTSAATLLVHLLQPPDVTYSLKILKRVSQCVSLFKRVRILSRTASVDFFLRLLDRSCEQQGALSFQLLPLRLARIMAHADSMHKGDTVFNLVWQLIRMGAQLNAMGGVERMDHRFFSRIWKAKCASSNDTFNCRPGSALVTGGLSVPQPKYFGGRFPRPRRA